MNILRAALFSVCVSASTVAFCQQEPMPEKVSPDTVKLLQEQEKSMKDFVEEAKKHPEPKFGYLQCRVDAQKWTADPFDPKDRRDIVFSTAIMVNGLIRSIPPITTHVTVNALMERTYEMAVCETEDAEFEKQFSTYSSLSKAFSEERYSRYWFFVVTHHLDEQFHKEDAEANK